MLSHQRFSSPPSWCVQIVTLERIPIRQPDQPYAAEPVGAVLVPNVLPLTSRDRPGKETTTRRAVLECLAK